MAKDQFKVDTVPVGERELVEGEVLAFVSTISRGGTVEHLVWRRVVEDRGERVRSCSLFMLDPPEWNVKPRLEYRSRYRELPAWMRERLGL